MGTALTGTTPQDTYDSLIKVTDNGPLSGTLKALSDGLGNDSTLSLSTAAASIAGTLAVTGAATLSSTLAVSGDTTLSGASGDRTLKIQSNTTGNPILNFTAAGDNAGTIEYVRGSSIIRSTMGSVKTELVDGTGLIVTGNVGIGTDAPASLLHISQASADTTLRIGNNAAYDQFIYFNGANDWSFGMDYSDSNAFVLSNASTVGTNNRLVFTTAGVIEVSQGQLQFPATQVASANANTLDDYEEGEWTPSLATDGTNFTSVTYDAANRIGRYTKIGNTVFFRGIMRTTGITVGSASGNVVISGLPFTAASSSARPSVSLSEQGRYGVWTTSPSSASVDGLIISLLKLSALGGDESALAVGDVDTGSSKNFMQFAGFYQV